MKKKILFTAGIGLSVSAIALAVSCGGGTSTNQTEEDKLKLLTEDELVEKVASFKGKVQVAYEQNQKDILDKTVTLMPEALRSKIELVPIENGKSTEYLTTLETQAAKSADLFASPLDRIQGFIDKEIVLPVEESELTQYGKNKALVNFKEKYYGYPLNVESVIAIYNSSVYPDGLKDFTEEFSKPVEKKFVFQIANLWQGSTLLSGMMHDLATDKEKAQDFYSSIDAEGKYSAPFLKNEKLLNRVKDMWKYQNALRTSESQAFKDIANNLNDRENLIQKGLAEGTIDSTFDGPWQAGKFLSNVLLNNKENKAKAVEIINQIKSSALPKIGQEQLRHFIGGWAYLVNKVKVTSEKDTDALVYRLSLTNYFAKKLTSSQLASDWYSKAQKISADVSSNIELDLDSLTIADTSKKDTNFDLTEWKATPGFNEAIKAYYSSLLKAVTSQAGMNIPQPTWPTGGYWDSFDRLGLSDNTLDTVEKFVTAFEKNVNQVITAQNNKK